MWRYHTLDRTEIDEKLIQLENQIRNSYYKASIIENVCTIKDVPESIEYGEYQQFAQKLRINRAPILDTSGTISMDEIGRSLAFGEINFIIKLLSDYEKLTIDTFSVEKIEEKFFEMKTQNYTPNMIFIPIEYYHEIHEWNKTYKPYGSEGSMFDRLYFRNGNYLKIQYSNKKIELEDIVITSKDVNQWHYRLDSETQGRITVKFDWDAPDPENAILLIKTVFKFVNEDKNGNALIKIADFKKRTI